MRVNIRCLSLGTSSSRLDSHGTVAEQAPVSWLVAATSTSYLIKLANPMPGRTVCVIGRHQFRTRRQTLKPRPPPFLPHAPSQPLCIHKTTIWTCRSPVRAQGFPSAFLWQHRGPTADPRSTSKPPSQRRYQALSTVITRDCRFCGYISSIADGGLAAIRSHSCMLAPGLDHCTC